MPHGYLLLVEMAPLRAEISFSQGAEWKALISMYIGTMPLSGDAAAQSTSCGPPPRTPVRSAMIAKAGAAARHSQSAAPRAAGANRSSCEIVCVVMAFHSFFAGIVR